MSGTIKFCVILFCLVAYCTGFAQTPQWQWVQGGGGGGFPGSTTSNPGTDGIVTSVIDKEGNMIVGGTVSWYPEFDTIDFGQNANWQNPNFLLAKYDACGNVIWARVGGGDGGDIIEGVDVDEEGNIYTLGMLTASGNPVYINTPNKDTVLYNLNYFFSKFDKDGNLKYVKTFSWNGGYWFLRKGMFKRLKNGLFLSTISSSIGGFMDNYWVNPNSNNFILLDTLGNIAKAGLIDTIGSSTIIGSVVTDENDNIYFSISNLASSIVSILGSVINPAPIQATYLVKTDSSLRLARINTNGRFNEPCTYLSYANNFLYGAGRSRNGAYFENDTTTTSLNIGRFTVYKIDTALHLIWSRTADVQNVNPTFTTIKPAASRDNVYLAYEHRGLITWDSVSLSTPANTYKMAMLRLRTSDGICTNGEFAAGATTDKDDFNLLRTDHYGNAYFIGTYINTIGTPSTLVTAKGGASSPDFFILKWGLSCTDTTAQPVCSSSISFTKTDSTYSFSTTNTGTANYTYQWSFNGTNFSTSATPSRVITSIGTHSICVTVTDANQCTSSDCDTVTVTSAPVCSTSISFTKTGSTYSFSTVNTGTANYNYQWSDNGVNFSTSATPSRNISVGAHTVCVTVTDASQCTSTDCENITITGLKEWAPLNASLYPNPTTGLLYLNLSVQSSFTAILTVTDMVGQVMQRRSIKFNEGANNVEISTEGWPAGVYQFHLSGQEGNWSGGVIKY